MERFHLLVLQDVMNVLQEAMMLVIISVLTVGLVMFQMQVRLVVQHVQMELMIMVQIAV